MKKAFSDHVASTYLFFAPISKYFLMTTSRLITGITVPSKSPLSSTVWDMFYTIKNHPRSNSIRTNQTDHPSQVPHIQCGRPNLPYFDPSFSSNLIDNIYPIQARIVNKIDGERSVAAIHKLSDIKAESNYLYNLNIL